jgi:hypothetical protein
MTKEEYFKLFENGSHIGTKSQQDQIYEIALALFKNIDDVLIKKFGNNPLLITQTYDGTIEIEQIFDNLRFGYTIENDRKLSSWFFVSNENAGDYMEYGNFDENNTNDTDDTIESTVKIIILWLKEQIDNLFVEPNL